MSDTLEVVGNAAAVNQVSLVARVPGYLEQIHFEDGAIVAKGDLLFTIQQDQYKAQLQQAQAQLEAATVARDHAKLEVGRYTALLKQHATSQVEVDHWVFEQQTAEANIKAAQAQVAIAQLNLSYTEVRAPFDGQMGKHLIDVGNMVGASPQTAVLAEITQLNPIYVVANISSQQALQIRANLDQRRLTLGRTASDPDRGRLVRRDRLSAQGKAGICRAGDRPGHRHALSAGRSSQSDADLPAGDVRQAPPADGQGPEKRPARPADGGAGGSGRALSPDVNDSNVVEKRYVQLGETIGSLQTVEGGLNRADRMVVGELWRASPGMTVTPKLTTEAP